MVSLGGVLASTGKIFEIETRVEELPGLVKRQKNITANNIIEGRFGNSGYQAALAAA